MPCLETLRNASEIWRLFSDMPDDAAIGVDLAALYLGVSVKTLARYRQNGDGPPYVQYQSSESKARNQRVNYLLGDLRAWRNNHRVSSTMQAAQVRGLAFTSLKDFVEPQPFWADSSDDKIIGHILTLPHSIFKDCLKKYTCEITWLSVEEGLLRQWKNAEERKIWHGVFQETIQCILLESTAQQEKHEIFTSLDGNY